MGSGCEMQQLSCMLEIPEPGGPGEARPDTACEPPSWKWCWIGLIIFFIVLSCVTAVALLYVNRTSCSAPPDSEGDWIRYQGKSFNFSEKEGDWNASQSLCASIGASLAVIETWQEMEFVKRYKGTADHWMGLKRERGEAWKWPNDTEYNNMFPIEGDSDCAYLNEIGIGSGRCYNERKWICTKTTWKTQDAV